MTVGMAAVVDEGEGSQYGCLDPFVSNDDERQA